MNMTTGRCIGHEVTDEWNTVGYYEIIAVWCHHGMDDKSRMVSSWNG